MLAPASLDAIRGSPDPSYGLVPSRPGGGVDARIPSLGHLPLLGGRPDHRGSPGLEGDGKRSLKALPTPDRVAGSEPRSAVWVLGSSSNTTNCELVREWRKIGVDAELLSPRKARSKPSLGAVALGRLDVAETLDGLEEGLLDLLWLERSGARVLNRAYALLTVHDKVRTARRLRAAAIPHPRAIGWLGEGKPPLEPPLVLEAPLWQLGARRVPLSRHYGARADAGGCPQPIVVPAARRAASRARAGTRPRPPGGRRRRGGRRGGRAGCPAG